MSEQIIFSISQINEYIKDTLDQDVLLQNVWLKGEISNFKAHYSGHLYLTLKDEKSTLKSVMFKNTADKLIFAPKDGMKVIIRCKISVYEAAGNYQAYIHEMKTDGVGDLHVAYEQLKEKLRLEGLFDEGRKKKLPQFPECIGLVTSATGAAVRDIINILNRRYPYTKVLLYSVLVQGEDAPRQIIEGIKYFNNYRNADVLIVGRGGGSIEDLWAFNDEDVARTIAGSNIPIISAVGHETDFTIADFVADRRAPTPSAAAEIAVPSTVELKQRLKTAEEKLSSLLKKHATDMRHQMERLSSEKVFNSFKNSIDERKIKVDDLFERIHRNIITIIQTKKERLATGAAGLGGLSPLGVLSRGYSIVQTKDKKCVSKVKDVKPNDKITIRVTDGDIVSIVE